MKAKIFIKGQISGNFTLLNNISSYHHEEGMFNSFHCYFDSVKEAKKAIKDGYLSLKNDLDPDNYGVVSKSKDNTSLSYDASTANVFKLYNGDWVDC